MSTTTQHKYQQQVQQVGKDSLLSILYITHRPLCRQWGFNLYVRGYLPVWQPAPVQPGGHEHLFQRIQVPPWAQGGEHKAEITHQHVFYSLSFIHFSEECFVLHSHQYTDTQSVSYNHHLQKAPLSFNMTLNDKRK